MNSNESWFCSVCLKSQLPFSSLNENELSKAYRNDSQKSEDATETQHYFDRANNLFCDEEENPIKHYFDIQQFNDLAVSDDHRGYLHLNI